MGKRQVERAWYRGWERERKELIWSSLRMSLVFRVDGGEAARRARVALPFL